MANSEPTWRRGGLWRHRQGGVGRGERVKDGRAVGGQPGGLVGHAPTPVAQVGGVVGVAPVVGEWVARPHGHAHGGWPAGVVRQAAVEEVLLLSCDVRRGGKLRY